MAANSGDLVQSLIEGGLAPQAARIIGNVLANANSPNFSKGGDSADATPAKQLRLIDADARRYVLTNLDFSPSAPFQQRLTDTPGKYAGLPDDHPYKDSQPVSSAAPLAAPRVQANDYIQVDNHVEGNSAVSKVGLRLRLQEGRHLRVDPSTKFLDAVNLTARTESPQFLVAEFAEGGQSTELVVSLRNLAKTTIILADGTKQEVFVFPEAAPVAAGNQFLTAIGTAAFSEGTWTPVMYSFTGTNPSFTVDAALTVGRWYRTGQYVHAWGRFRVTAMASAGTGNMAIRGLPFPCETAGRPWGGSLGVMSGFSSNGPEFAWAQDMTNLGGNDNSIALGRGNVSTSFITNANLTGSLDFSFAAHYRTAAA